MKTSFFRIMLMVCAGGYITIMGYSPYGATPLLVVTGIGLIVYAISLFLISSDLSDNGQPISRTAHPCLEANHAGCQDNPACACGCHRERIEVGAPSF